MGQLIGLPGTKRTLKAVPVKTAQEMIKVIKRGHGATTAGDHGALNAWIDDVGRMRFARSQRLFTRECVVVRTVTCLKTLWQNGVRWCHGAQDVVQSAHTFIESLEGCDLFVASEVFVHMELNRRQHEAVQRHLSVNGSHELDPCRAAGLHILNLRPEQGAWLIRFCQERNIRARLDITLQDRPL